eukprot:SAG31_NODE_168_length_21484_cov_21.524994_6_plen_61_part_00
MLGLPTTVSNAGSALTVTGNMTMFGAVTMADGGVALPQVGGFVCTGMKYRYDVLIYDILI